MMPDWYDTLVAMSRSTPLPTRRRARRWAQSAGIPETVLEQTAIDLSSKLAWDPKNARWRYSDGHS